LAEHVTVKKRHRQSLRARAANRAVRSTIRTAVKKVKTSIGNDGASKNLSSLASQLDRAVKNNLIHKKAAARYKSRLSRKINQAATESN